MSRHQIHVFISHSWAYSGHYETLAKWIFRKPWSIGQASLVLLDYSIPKNDPIHDAPTSLLLRAAIYRKIARCHVIVIPTGMYTHYSPWIREEIDGAIDKAKPILAVDPWGQQRRASVVAGSADELVGWNSKSVIGGIWKLYRQ